MKLQTIARSVAAFTLCAGALFSAGLTVAYAGTREPLTVARALETARIMNNPDAAGSANPDGAVAVSPDGRRYVVRVVRGDVQRNGVWMEMLTGRMDSFEGARAPRLVARLFTSGLGAGIGNFGSDQDVFDYIPLRWLDNERVAFLWSDERSVRQLVSVDLESGKVERLTNHPSAVNGFDLSRDGVVLYNARAREASAGEEEKSGFVVPATADAFSIFHRNLQATGFDVAWNVEWFILDAARGTPRPLKIAGRDVDLMSWHSLSLAPDGRRALVSSAPETYPEEWDRYGGVLKAAIAVARRDVRNWGARIVQQLFVVEIASGATRPLWNTLSTGSDVKWSDDGRSVLVTSTYLPAADADADGLEGRATAIVDVATGQYRRLPIDLRGRHVLALRWLSADEVQIDSRKGDDVQHARFRRNGAEWRIQSDGGKPADKATPPIRIEMRQDLDTPPRLYVVELRDSKAIGREEMILDPNPGLLEQVALGRAEMFSGKLDGEDSWKGLLFYPVDYRPGQRYPLLIQSIYGGGIRSQFTLYGLGDLGPTLVASYPGRILAGRGVAVLVLDVQMGAKFGGPMEGETRKNAFIAAAGHLVEKGIADRTKIGLAGFSRNGWYAEYTLTHSDFPFAAAIAADNWDPSYVPTVWLDGYAQAGTVNGAEPFGEGLKAWLEKAPGFNADRVRVPLLKIEQSTGGLFGVMAQWELFSRLRYLKKPVEFYVMPQAAEHGAHNTQNPGQIMAVQQRAVDWFDFWLTGREDPNPQKADQYAGWRKLREAHLANLAQMQSSNTSQQ